MNTSSPSWLSRSLGLLVRHWARNMTLVHDQGSVWPGFGYDLSEQAALRAIARRVPTFEFMVWTALTVVFALLFMAALVLLGTWLLVQISPSHSFDSVSGAAFTVSMGVNLVAGLAFAFPAAMLLASVFTGRFCGVTDGDLPDSRVQEHYIYKLSWQFMRMALVMGVVVVAACLWLPDRVWLLTRCVVPVLAPAVSIVTWFWYTHRPKDGDQGAVVDTRDSTSNST